MRYVLTDAEWRLIYPILPNKQLGVSRVDDRHSFNGIFWVCGPVRCGAICPRAMAHI